MPRATIDRDQTFRFELKSLEGGFVALRKLSYHEMAQRQDISGRIIYEQKNQLRKKKGVKQDEMVRQLLEMAQTAVVEFEFKNCIADHNLTDGNDQLLDFSNPLAIRNLDPTVGSEISKYIDEVNPLIEDVEEEDEDFPNALTSSSPGGETKPTSIMGQSAIEKPLAGSGTEG